MTGGGIFGGSNKQTTTSSSEPWEGAQPTLEKSLKLANKAADASSLWKPYTGSTVVPWDRQTTNAMGAITNNANANMGSRGLGGQLQGVINAGGYNPAQQAALKNTQTLANSKYSVTPELQAVLDSTGAQAANQVNLGASAAGRYGGGLHQGAVAREVGDVTNRAILSDYQNFQSRRDAANSNLFDMGQTAFGNLGTAYTGLNAPAQDLMTVGSMNEDLATRQMNDKLRIFNESQNLPKQRAEWLNAIGSGAGSLGGTSRSSQPGQNPFLQALGYGTSALGLLGGF